MWWRDSQWNQVFHRSRRHLPISSQLLHHGSDSGLKRGSLVSMVGPSWMKSDGLQWEMTLTKWSGKSKPWARESIDWVERWKLEFDTVNTDAALITHWQGHKKHLRLMLSAKIRIGQGLVRLTQQTTRSLLVWMDTHLTFKVHQNLCIKSARRTAARLRSLTGVIGVVAGCAKSVQIACIQAVALYWGELRWDAMEDSRQDNRRLLQNQQGWRTMGGLPTHREVRWWKTQGSHQWRWPSTPDNNGSWRGSQVCLMPPSQMSFTITLHLVHR